jgi:hypothetical protein
MTATDDAVDHLADRAGGDGRQVLTALEVACALAGRNVVELDHVESALGTSALRYGRDDHYDVVSAFIKSIRGSDVDAALHWLARMLEAGEDARFIARRLVISASEDVGMADPRLIQSMYIFKQPRIGGEVVCHQDSTFLYTEPKSCVGLWFALEDATVENGCMWGLPGRHREGLRKRDAAYRRSSRSRAPMGRENNESVAAAPRMPTTG